MMKESKCFDDVLILWSSRYDYDEGWRLRPHVHDDLYQLIYCLAGKGTAVVEGSAYDIASNAALLLKPGTMHEINDIGKEGLQTLDVKFVINDKTLIEELDKLPFYISECPSDVQRNLERINYEGQHKMYGYIQQGRLYLSLILLDILRMSHPEKISESQPDIFCATESLSYISAKVINFIKKDFGRRIVSHDFEVALNFSYRYLSCRTVKDTGYSPMGLLYRYRCYVAKKYLSVDCLSVKQIAALVGYPDVHHFTRVFYRVEGKPPARYRKDILSTIRKDLRFSEGFVNTNNTVMEYGEQ